MHAYRKSYRYIVIFLLPAILLYAIFEVIPVIASLMLSFFDWNGIKDSPFIFVGMKNFTKLFADPYFILSLKNILYFLLVSLITQIPLGFGLALLLNNVKRGLRVYKVSLFLPLILPLTATSILWRYILFPNDMGLLNQLLAAIGLEHWQTGWLIDSRTALLSVILITAWSGAPYYMVLGVSALASIPAELIDSAEIDGSTGWNRLINITIPLIWETIKVSVILLITGILKIFDIVYILTSGGPDGKTDVPSSFLLNESFKYGHYGTASAVSMIIFLLSLAGSLLSLALMKKEKLEY